MPGDTKSYDFKRENEHTPVIVMLPSIGEQNCARCRTVAERLVEIGCAVILCENPMRGLRAPKGDDGCFDTVTSMLSGGYGVVDDARHLIQHFNDLGYDRLCLAGLSMGGEMAALDFSAGATGNTGTSSGSGAFGRPQIRRREMLHFAVHRRNFIVLRGARNISEAP